MAKLNTQQELAVNTTEGAVLVLSGAGTGKTSVLVARTAHILNENLAFPWQILALTFTNKAANEMKSRILSATNIDACDIWMGTFHSIALRILRRNAAAAGLQQNFLVFGEDEQRAVLKSVILGLNLDIKDYPPADWVEKISAQKDKGLNAPENTTRNFERIYNAYNAELNRLNATDFGDLILRTLQMFVAHSDVLQKYQRQFKYVMVDEYQDTNAAQYQLIKMLSAGYGNICCVGDDDQSIYSWRGAEIKNILGFEREYPGAKIIRLETNYRSTGHILSAANSLIKNNTGRLGKDLRPAPNVSAGEKIIVREFDSDLEESHAIATDVMRAPKNDTAILIRAGSLSRTLEETFAAFRINYKLVGATKFYDRMEIRDAIAYIRLMVFPFDDLSFLRIISRPRRGFGERAIENLRGIGGNLMASLRAAPLAPKQRKSADEFLRAFDFDWDAMPPADAAAQILENSGYMKMWRESRDIDAPDRLKNIDELLSGVIAKYETLADFLEHAALMMTEDDDEESSDNAVRIMTIHAAKGLEFDTVFLPAWEEGIFPNERAINDGGLEEERRLAYVAITRAQRRCIISYANSRMVFGKWQHNSPSRFIGEIDTQFIDATLARQGGHYNNTNHESRITNQYESRTTNHEQKLVGQMVSHDDFGRGVVISENGDILTVAFKNRGIKNVVKRFLKWQ